MASTSFSRDEINLISESGEKISFDRSQIEESSPLLKALLENCVGHSQTAILTNETSGKLIQLKRYLEKRYPRLPSLDNAFDLYKMAKCYMISGFVLYIKDFIKQQINPITVCRIYDFAYKQEDQFLQYHCWREFDEKCAEVLATREFSACQENVIDMFVSRPKYRALEEKTLFESMVRWAERKIRAEKNTYPDPHLHQERIRYYLNPFFKKIRFLSMELEELSTVFSYNILSKEEAESIYRCVSSGSSDGLPNTISEKNVKRIKACYRSLIIYKDRYITKLKTTRFLHSDSKFYCRFIPQENCFLYEIILPIKTSYEKLEVNIKIYRENDLFREDNYDCMSSGKIFIFKPLFLQKNIEYFLSASVDLEKYNKPIPISREADLYVRDEENSKSNWNFNQCYCKIRLYF